MKQKRLKRLQVAWLEQEALELGIEIPLQSFIFGSENGDAVLADSIFEWLQEESFLDELSEFGVMRVEKCDQD